MRETPRRLDAELETLVVKHLQKYIMAQALTATEEPKVQDVPVGRQNVPRRNLPANQTAFRLPETFATLFLRAAELPQSRRQRLRTTDTVLLTLRPQPKGAVNGKVWTGTDTADVDAVPL